MGTEGNYWMATANGSNAYKMQINATASAAGVQVNGSANRALGYSIRCVKE